VLDAFAERVLRPERLQALLSAYVARSAEADAGRKQRLSRLRSEATEARAGVQRLLALVEAGQLEADDPDLRERLAAAKERRRRAEEEIRLLEGQADASGPRAITQAKVARLGEAIRRALAEGDPAFRRAYLRLFVGRVVVGDEEIRISGPTAALAHAASDGGSMPSETSSQFHPVWRSDRNPGTTFSGALLGFRSCVAAATRCRLRASRRMAHAGWLGGPGGRRRCAGVGRPTPAPAALSCRRPCRARRRRGPRRCATPISPRPRPW